MKYLIILLVVLAVIWLVRNNRRGGERKPEPPRQPAAGEPQDMVRCPVCSLHLPRTDALPGLNGTFYCCADHRARAGE